MTARPRTQRVRLTGRTLQSVTPLWILLAVALAGSVTTFAGLRVNLTTSMPLGLYRIHRGEVTAGTVVALCLSKEQGEYALQRGYLGSGRCPGRVTPVMKRVGAVGGDVVRITDNSVQVNGRFLQTAGPEFDRLERRLHALPAGRYELSPTELWVYSENAHSWDSRFFGPVPRSNVLGAVDPLWIVRTPRASTFPRESSTKRWHS